MNERRDGERLELHLEAGLDGVKAAELIAVHCALSRVRIQTAMSQGAAWLENQHGIHRNRRAGKLLKPGERLHFYYDPRIVDSQPPVAQLVADEGDYSVWNKPPGMFSQGSKWGDHCSIGRWAETRLDPPRQSWPVHRLDRATGGLILLAHRRKVAGLLSELFARREVGKRYHATVEGRLARALPLTIERALDDKTATTVIEGLEYDSDNDVTRVEARILTGRKHQVRRHLQALGHPLIGDRLYGSRDRQTDLQLCAVGLAFRCPLTGLERDYRLPETT